MKKIIVCVVTMVALALGVAQMSCPAERSKTTFLLDGLEEVYLSQNAQELLKQNGFVITPGHENEIFDLYDNCKKNGQPIFVTTDAVLHTSHIFFDYLLRILEIEKLYPLTDELTDRMLTLSIKQYNEARNSEVKEAARLNIGFFAVAKKQFNPAYKVSYGLNDLVDKEIKNIESHEGLKFRELLTYVKNPSLGQNPYAYEDYSQYVPRGHYTRNEKFKKYFKTMMWYGRIDFKLKPGTKEPAITHGKKMTLQAILMTDAFLKDKEVFKLWKKIYEPTVYFVGKTDDLYADDYLKLIKEIFPTPDTVDEYANQSKLSQFIEEATKLRPPKILSGAAFVEEGEFAVSTKGFRFMGQRFIPDSYMFQELVYGIKDRKEILKYKGKEKPFTMEVIPNVGPARAFPRGLDILAVLGSKRALEILEKEGDTEYTNYYDQLNKLKEEFSSQTTGEWKQNLYWRWLYSLLPLLEERKEENLPKFMQSAAWIDKELQATLGSWAELRHDTILYTKQSYPMMVTAMPQEPKRTHGYVEPYLEVYVRIEEMMRDLRSNLAALGIVVKGIPEKIEEFEDLLAKLKTISEKELSHKELSEAEYSLIRNIGDRLASLKRFPEEIMKKITSGTDEKIDLIADVHTDPNTKQVLEEGVGSPFNIYVIIDDGKGYRLCRGGVFSYYEFKHSMKDRLTDEKWQEMGKDKIRPPQPDWVRTFTAK
jgi:hypothetical protein